MVFSQARRISKIASVILASRPLPLKIHLCAKVQYHNIRGAILLRYGTYRITSVQGVGHSARSLFGTLLLVIRWYWQLNIARFYLGK